MPLTHIRVAIIKEIRSTIRKWSNGNPCAMLVIVYNGATSVKICMY